MNDILTEYGLGERLRQVDLNRFIDQGIPSIYLARNWCGTYCFLQRDRVAFDGVNRFEFARYIEGDLNRVEYAFTFLAFDDDGQPTDIVAWRPGVELALWLGRVWCLGQEQVGDPYRSEPLHVHTSTLNWMRAGREGIQVINWPLAAWELRNAGTLAAETKADVEFIRGKLALPPPPITVEPFVSIDLAEHAELAELHGAAA